MTSQQGAPEALTLAGAVEHWARCDYGLRGDEMRRAAVELRRLHAENARLAALVEAQQPAKAESLRQILTDPENQPNQYGVQFLMHGPKMAFKIGARQFTLDYEPTEPGEFEFMRDALISAFSIFTPDVKMAQQPAPSATKRICNTCQGTGIVKGLHNWGSGGTREEKCWNCHEAPQPAPSAAAAGNALPEGWVPLVITHEGQYPEEVAYGPQILMDRLGKWLRKYFDHVVASKAQPSPTPQADSQPAPVVATGHDEADQIINRLMSSDPDFEDCMRAAMLIQREIKGPDGYPTWRDAAVAARAARAPADSVTAPAGGVVDGWKWAPEEPTLHMGWAYLDAARESDPLRTHTFNHAGYRAMLAAAPTPPAQAADSVLEDAAREVLMEHSGCGSGTQVDMLTVRLNPGDKVVMLKGRITQAIDAARKQGGAT